MHRLLVDQKLWSLREQFTVADEHGGAVYTVEGSLFQIPKQFTISDVAGRPRARVWKKPLSWLPQFTVEVEGVPVATITKELAFRPRYRIDGPGIAVVGDLWNMSFELLKDGAPIGRVDKKWSLRDQYAIEIDDPQDELVVLGIVLAIDTVKRTESAAASS
ncbi:MAG: hypothetical protein FWF90_06695 [Promicromonosporaceae bacterium]|nr:hypothetical protein [Promicromonosporaceae bacterium]